MEQNNIRTFKDFLTFYNLMSETCFTHCVDNFNSRSLELEEERCVEKCIGKYISLNHRVLRIYSEAQQKLMKKRIEEQERLNKEVQPEISENVVPIESTSIETSQVDDTK